MHFGSWLYDNIKAHNFVLRRTTIVLQCFTQRKCVYSVYQTQLDGVRGPQDEMYDDMMHVYRLTVY
jgi:hypothetical protein